MEGSGLWEKEEVLRQIFNDHFCKYLLDFLIKEGMTTSDFEERGKKFFKKIREWKDTYFLEEKKIELFGVQGWDLYITAMEFCFDFYSATKEDIGNYALIMFLVCQCGDLELTNNCYYKRKYDEAFFQRHYPEFLELFVGKEEILSDFEKNLCDEFQYEFSQKCVVQMTKEMLIQELESYEEESLNRFSYYCKKERKSVNEGYIVKLEKEYPRYHDFISKWKEDSGILQVFRINEHTCSYGMYYIVERYDSVCFLMIEDYI